MESTTLIPAEAYKYIYDIVLGFICLVSYSQLIPYTHQGLIRMPDKRYGTAILLCIIVAMFIGFRPISASFADMLGYAASYDYFDLTDEYKDIGLWWLAGICKNLGFSANMWFAVVSFIYFGGFLISARLLTKNSAYYTFLTILVAFSTLTYATTGIRNGMGLSLLTLAMSVFLTQKGKWKLLSLGIFLYAYLTHASSILPLICFFVAYYAQMGLRFSMCFWAFSVLVSLVAGSQVSSIFLGWGFDDRMDNYLLSDDFTGFSRSGFRFDFLLYSIMPIVLGYYALIKKGVNDRVYEVLLSTYILSNAFWVMVIRARFSDRFAYLSWFLYPIVIAYPLLKVDIWGNNQGRMARNILLLHFAFTFFMNVVYYTVIKTVL